MATFARQQVRIAGRFGATSSELIHGIEAAAQNYLEGHVVRDNGSGAVEEAADGQTAAAILGLAGADATGTTSESCPIAPFVPGTVIEVNLTEGIDTNHIFAQTDLYVAFGLTKNTGDLYTLDATDAGYDATAFAVPFEVVRGRDATTGVESKGAVGDSNVVVKAVVIQSAFMLGV